MSIPALPAGSDAVRPRRSGAVDRRFILQGLGAFLLAGCASAPRPAKTSTAKTASSAGSTGPNTASKAAAGQNGSQPKTVQEFVKQQPTRLPFNDKE